MVIIIIIIVNQVLRTKMEERMSELLSSELEKSINDIEVALDDNCDDKNKMTMKMTMVE